MERILARSAPAENGCIVWTGPTIRGGYAQMMVDGRRQVVHRIAYEQSVGPIPEGMQLDHLCRNRACVNPAHLEPVTPRENTRRGEAGLHRRVKALAITHCLHGHEYTPENTAVVAGKRRCRTCHRERDRAR